MPCLCESIVCVPLQILSEGLSMLTLACCCGHKSVVRSELSYLFAAICTEFTMYESVGNKVSLPNVFICQIFSFPFYRRTISTKEKASVNRRGRDKTAKYPNKWFTVMPHVTCQQTLSLKYMKVTVATIMNFLRINLSCLCWLLLICNNLSGMTFQTFSEACARKFPTV